MSNNTSFYVQGRIEPSTPFHIAAKIDIAGAAGNLAFDGPTTGNGWAVLGVQEKYTNFDEVIDKPFYHFDGTNYFYPLYFVDDAVDGITLASTSTLTGLDITTGAGDDKAYIDTTATVNSGSSGTTTPPPAKLHLKSSVAFKNTTFYLEDTEIIEDTDKGYYYGMRLTAFTGGDNSTKTYNGVEFNQESPSIVSQTTLQPNPPICFFGNPYEMLTETTFTHYETGTSVFLKLASCGHYLTNAAKYTNIYYDTVNNCIGAFEDPNDNGYFTLSVPTDYNLNNVNKFAGVPYTLYYKNDVESTTSKAPFNFLNSMTDDFDLSQYISFQGTASTTNIMLGNPAQTDITATTAISNYFSIYFIPTLTNTYQVSTNDLLVYLDYSPFDMLAASPYVYGVNPLIIDGPAYSSTSTNYYTWKTKTGLSTAHNELAFVTSMHDSLQRIVSRYCGEGEYCGACLGHCDITDPFSATAGSCRCVLDSLSVDKIGTDEMFTCDSQRYLEKSKYVSRGSLGTHSKTILIIVITLIIIIIAGFVLYEERNRIFKNFLKHKGKTHHHVDRN